MTIDLTRERTPYADACRTSQRLWNQLQDCRRARRILDRLPTLGIPALRRTRATCRDALAARAAELEAAYGATCRAVSAERAQRHDLHDDADDCPVCQRRGCGLRRARDTPTHDQGLTYVNPCR